MSPIDFNPSNRPSVSREKVNGPKQQLENNAASKRDPAPEKNTTDTFTKSETLKNIQTLISSPRSESTEQQRLKRIETLKQQIKTGTHPILSDNPEKREQAALRVADQIVAIEKRLAET